MQDRDVCWRDARAHRYAASQQDSDDEEWGTPPSPTHLSDHGRAASEPAAALPRQHSSWQTGRPHATQGAGALPTAAPAGSPPHAAARSGAPPPLQLPRAAGTAPHRPLLLSPLRRSTCARCVDDDCAPRPDQDGARDGDEPAARRQRRSSSRAGVAGAGAQSGGDDGAAASPTSSPGPTQRALSFHHWHILPAAGDAAAAAARLPTPPAPPRPPALVLPSSSADPLAPAPPSVVGGGALASPLAHTPTWRDTDTHGELPRLPRDLSFLSIAHMGLDALDDLPAPASGPASPAHAGSPRPPPSGGSGDDSGSDAMPRGGGGGLRASAGSGRDQDLRRAALLNRSLSSGMLPSPPPTAPDSPASPLGGGPRRRGPLSPEGGGAGGALSHGHGGVGGALALGHSGPRGALTLSLPHAAALGSYHLHSPGGIAVPPTPRSPHALSPLSQQRYAAAVTAPASAAAAAAAASGSSPLSPLSPDGGGGGVGAVPRTRLRGLRDAWPELTGAGGAEGGAHAGCCADGMDGAGAAARALLGAARTGPALHQGTLLSHGGAQGAAAAAAAAASAAAAAAAAQGGGVGSPSDHAWMSHNLVGLVPYRMREVANMAIREGWSRSSSAASLAALAAPAASTAPADPIEPAPGAAAAAAAAAEAEAAMERYLGGGVAGGGPAGGSFRVNVSCRGPDGPLPSPRPSSGAAPPVPADGACGSDASSVGCQSPAGGAAAAGAGVVAAVRAPVPRLVSARQWLGSCPPSPQVQGVLKDTAFVSVLLSTLPGVDARAHVVERTLQALQGRAVALPAPCSGELGGV